MSDEITGGSLRNAIAILAHGTMGSLLHGDYAQLADASDDLADSVIGALKLYPEAGELILAQHIAPTKAELERWSYPEWLIAVREFETKLGFHHWQLHNIEAERGDGEKNT